MAIVGDEGGVVRRCLASGRRRFVLWGSVRELWNRSTHQIGGAFGAAAALQLTAGDVRARLTIRHTADRDILDASALTADATRAALAVGATGGAHRQATFLLLRGNFAHAR